MVACMNACEAQAIRVRRKRSPCVSSGPESCAGSQEVCERSLAAVAEAVVAAAPHAAFHFVHRRCPFSLAT
jgi:hypothetical protein